MNAKVIICRRFVASFQRRGYVCSYKRFAGILLAGDFSLRVHSKLGFDGIVRFFAKGIDMRNSLLRVHLLCAMPLTLTGCGAIPAMSSATSPQRSAITTCRNGGATDAFIDSAFTIIRSAQRDGISSTQLLGVTIDGCFDFIDPEVREDCTQCFAAIIDEVYGL